MYLKKLIEVGMGDGVVARAPHLILSKGLGSCVAVSFYDTRRRIGGLAHIMLPDSSTFKNADYRIKNQKPEMGRSPIHDQRYRFADTAIATLLEELQNKGTGIQDVVAKIAGGARMFSTYGDGNPGIGAQNIMNVKRALRDEGIPLTGEDTGGHHGRSVELHLDSGMLIVKAVAKKDKEI